MQFKKVVNEFLLNMYFETQASYFFKSHIKSKHLPDELSPTETTNKQLDTVTLGGNVANRNESVDYDIVQLPRHQSTEGLRLLQSLSLPVMLLLYYTI